MSSDLLHGEVFLNSLLATLNTREILSEKFSGLSRISVSANTLIVDSPTKVSSQNPLVISINREVVEDYGVRHAQVPLSNDADNYPYAY